MQRNQKTMRQSVFREKRLYWDKMFQKGEFWDKFLLFTSHPVCSTFLWQPKPSKTSPGGKVHWMIVLLQVGGCGFKEGRESQVQSQQEVLTCFIFTPHIEPLTSMTKRMFLGIGSMFSGAKKWTKYPLNTWKTEHICGPNHYQCLRCRKMGNWGEVRRGESWWAAHMTVVKKRTEVAAWCPSVSPFFLFPPSLPVKVQALLAGYLPRVFHFSLLSPPLHSI